MIKVKERCHFRLYEGKNCCGSKTSYNQEKNQKAYPELHSAQPFRQEIQFVNQIKYH